MTRHLKGEHFTSFPNRTDELKNIIADYRRDYFNWEQFFIEEYDGEDFTEYLQDTCLYERKSFQNGLSCGLQLISFRENDKDQVDKGVILYIYGENFNIRDLVVVQQMFVNGRPQDFPNTRVFGKQNPRYPQNYWFLLHPKDEDIFYMPFLRIED